jgi:RNA dependent RNA polymerase
MRRLKLVEKNTLYQRAMDRYGSFGNVSFFDTVRNALVTSIRGSTAEASRMSGGDYDGDRAWVSWNTDLLQCLPSTECFVSEDTSTLTTPPSELEMKLWKDCGENDILQYMINFRNHHKVLGELCELLDCYIDHYGFNNEKTQQLGRAAFLQVRVFETIL